MCRSRLWENIQSAGNITCSKKINNLKHFIMTFQPAVTATTHQTFFAVSILLVGWTFLARRKGRLPTSCMTWQQHGKRPASRGTWRGSSCLNLVGQWISLKLLCQRRVLISIERGADVVCCIVGRPHGGRTYQEAARYLFLLHPTPHPQVFRAVDLRLRIVYKSLRVEPRSPPFFPF
ncbi:hypothetical protein B0J18DRAFT_436601 [Chaetomium sp. MPI-SDFR-AT-0129]|nr:hypothetical protein B0J18DRAFT_436601 [Chaetomium sp. MPI-SDFR-AT-0129]